MDERTAILLESAVDMIIQERIPVGYHKRIMQEGEGCSELEKVLRELKVPNAVPSGICWFFNVFEVSYYLDLARDVLFLNIFCPHFVPWRINKKKEWQC